MNLLRLSLRMLRRDWRAGELRILLLALLVAVGSVTTVGFFVDRFKRALSDQAGELLGADLVVVADHPVPPAFVQQARASGLTVAEAASFPSMAGGPELSTLTDIKAVSGPFPLRGKLRIATPAASTFGNHEAITRRRKIMNDLRCEFVGNDRANRNRNHNVIGGFPMTIRPHTVLTTFSFIFGIIAKVQECIHTFGCF